MSYISWMTTKHPYHNNFKQRNAQHEGKRVKVRYGIEAVANACPEEGLQQEVAGQAKQSV